MPSETPKGRLRILFVTGSLYEQSSGPFQILLETVLGLKEKGHSPFVIGSKDHPSDPEPSAWNPVPAHAFRKFGPFSMHFTPGLSRWLRELSKPADIVHLQAVWLYTHRVAVRWCRMKGIPYILTVYGNLNSQALGISRWKKRLARHWFVDNMLAGASCLHASSRGEYEAVRAFGLTNPVCIIPNPVSLPDLKADLPDVRAEHGIGVNPICLYLGRLHPIKGLDTLIRAWAQVSRNRMDWRLVLAGPDEEGHRDFLQKIAGEFGCGDRVVFVGSQFGVRKQAWFQASDFFVLPSRSEGFPMTAQESLAHGLPVLLTHACNFPEIGKRDAGMLVQPSIEGLTQGLARMMDLPFEKRSGMGKRGLELVETSFTPSRIASRLVAVYRWVLGKAHAPDEVVFD